MMEIRTLSIIVLPEGRPLFDDVATTITIVDESGGEFVEVSQVGNGLGKIAIGPEEWLDLKLAIDRMIGECRGNNE